MRNHLTAILAVIASLSIAAPALAAGRATSHSAPKTHVKTATATARAKPGAGTTRSARRIAQQVRQLRAGVAAERRKLKSDETTLIGVIRSDAAGIKALPWPLVAAAIRAEMRNYHLTSSQVQRIDALTTALHHGNVAGVARAAMHAVASVDPGQGVSRAMRSAGSGSQKSLLAMASLLQSLKSADAQIEQFVSAAKAL